MESQGAAMSLVTSCLFKKTNRVLLARKQIVPGDAVAFQWIRAISIGGLQTR